MGGSEHLSTEPAAAPLTPTATVDDLRVSRWNEVRPKGGAKAHNEDIWGPVEASGLREAEYGRLTLEARSFFFEHDERANAYKADYERGLRYLIAAAFAIAAAAVWLPWMIVPALLLAFFAPLIVAEPRRRWLHARVNTEVTRAFLGIGSIRHQLAALAGLTDVQEQISNDWMVLRSTLESGAVDKDLFEREGPEHFDEHLKMAETQRLLDRAKIRKRPTPEQVDAINEWLRLYFVRRPQVQIAYHRKPLAELRKKASAAAVVPSTLRMAALFVGAFALFEMAKGTTGFAATTWFGVAGFLAASASICKTHAEMMGHEKTIARSEFYLHEHKRYASQLQILRRVGVANWDILTAALEVCFNLERSGLEEHHRFLSERNSASIGL